MAEAGGVESNVANGLGSGKSRNPKRCRRNRMHRRRRHAGKRQTQFRMASIKAASELSSCVPRCRSMCKSVKPPAEMPTGVATARVTAEMPVPAAKMSAAVATPAAIRPCGSQHRQDTQQNQHCACRPRTETNSAGHDRPTPGTVDSSVLPFSGLAASAWEPVWTACSGTNRTSLSADTQSRFKQVY